MILVRIRPTSGQAVPDSLHALRIPQGRKNPYWRIGKSGSADAYEYFGSRAREQSTWAALLAGCFLYSGQNFAILVFGRIVLLNSR
jgi:hypothetical protein